MSSVEDKGVCMMMAQVVKEHIRNRNPFVWDTHVNGYHIVQRGRKACPMETYTVMNEHALAVMRENANSVSCDNSRGTYGVYTKKLTTLGYKVGLVLEPAIEKTAAARCWAPAKSWTGDEIKIPGFDFAAWEASHKDNTQKEFTLDTLEGLRGDYPEEYKGALEILVAHIKKYEPERDVALPPDPGTSRTTQQAVRRRRRKVVRPRHVTPDAKGIAQRVNPVQKVDVKTEQPVEGVIRRLPETGQLVRRVRSPRRVAIRKEQ
jgi:hypothetical protein